MLPTLGSPYRVHSTLGRGRRYAGGARLHTVAILTVLHCQGVHVLILIIPSIFSDIVLYTAILLILPILCDVPYLFIHGSVFLSAIHCKTHG